MACRRRIGSHGPVVALVGSYEMLAWMIRTNGRRRTGPRTPAGPRRTTAGPDGTDQASQAGGPVRKSTGPCGPAGLTVPGQATGAAPTGGINAAAAAAYRASLQDGKPLSERKLAAAYGRTSRRWARTRMAEARQRPVAG